MKILLVNPNSSEKVTRKIADAVEEMIPLGAAGSFGVDVEVISMKTAPQAIETTYDELMAASELMKNLPKLENAFDAMIVGCFSDPGLEALREKMKPPVVGIMEASLHMAMIRGQRFSVIASGGAEDIPVFYQISRKYGCDSGLASVRTLGIGVEGAADIDTAVVEENIRFCKEIDGADVVILGCAAFAGLGEPLTRKTGCIVLDGIRESVYMAKMMSEYCGR